MSEAQDEGFIAQQIKTVFGHTNLYEIFQVDHKASTNVIKKSYMKLALKHHPDKGGDAATFQAISMIHSILSDEERRKLYDECGLLESDDDTPTNDNTFDFWNEYFRNLFPKVTVQAIEKLAKEYIGSQEEEQDIINAYEKYNGDCLKVMETTMFAEAGEEQRIVNTIERLITEGKLESNAHYFKTKKRLLKGYEKYLNELFAENEEEEKDVDVDDDDEKEEHSHKKQNKRGRAAQDNQKKSKKEKKEKGPSLEELIAIKNQRKGNSSEDLFSKIISKYSDDPSALDDPLPDEEEFERIQKSISKPSSSISSAMKKKQKK